MSQGVDCIYRGTLSLDFERWQSIWGDKDWFKQLYTSHDEFLAAVNLVAAPSLLIKQPGESKFGDWEYIPINIKLGRRAKPEYKLISAFHAQLLATIQEKTPAYSQLILKEHNDYFINLDHWLIKVEDAIGECLTMLAQQRQPEVFISRQRCSLCSWHGHCYKVAKATNHLSLVPGITPKRYEYMQAIGVDSVESLMNVSEASLGETLNADIARQIKQQITAIKSDRAIVRADFDLINTQPIPSGAIELYFDIEAEPERQIDYLLGVLLVESNHQRRKILCFCCRRSSRRRCNLAAVSRSACSLSRCANLSLFRI